MTPSQSLSLLSQYSGAPRYVVDLIVAVVAAAPDIEVAVVIRILSSLRLRTTEVRLFIAEIEHAGAVAVARRIERGSTATGPAHLLAVAPETVVAREVRVQALQASLAVIRRRRGTL